MPPPLALNATVTMSGFVTQALFLRGRSADVLERSLGYAPGRLRNGWWLLFLERMPGPADFEFMGYSQMSGGVPQGHLNPPGGLTAEQALRRGGFDLARLKQKIIADVFRLSGPERLAKAVPLDPASGPMPYPPGGGIPQWEIRKHKPLPFRVVAFIGPGEVYAGNFA